MIRDDKELKDVISGVIISEDGYLVYWKGDAENELHYRILDSDAECVAEETFWIGWEGYTLSALLKAACSFADFRMENSIKINSFRVMQAIDQHAFDVDRCTVRAVYQADLDRDGEKFGLEKDISAYGRNHLFGIFYGKDMLGVCTLIGATGCSRAITHHPLCTKTAQVLENLKVCSEAKGTEVGSKLVGEAISLKRFLDDINSPVFVEFEPDSDLEMLYQKNGFQRITNSSSDMETMVLVDCI